MQMETQMKQTSLYQEGIYSSYLILSSVMQQRLHLIAPHENTKFNQHGDRTLKINNRTKYLLYLVVANLYLFGENINDSNNGGIHVDHCNLCNFTKCTSRVTKLGFLVIFGVTTLTRFTQVRPMYKLCELRFVKNLLLCEVYNAEKEGCSRNAS